MKYVLDISLEQIALVKLTTTLWNQDDIRALIVKFYLQVVLGNDKNEIWQIIEGKITEKVLQLEQPELLKEKILGLVTPIGSHILKWMKYPSNPYFDIINLPRGFSWTPQGTIERKKTAEILIQDDTLDTIKCYKLACNYCLKDHILELWNKIPIDYKKSIENDNFSSECLIQDLLLCITYDAKQEVAKMKNMAEKRLRHTTTDSPYMYAFGYATKSGNKAAVEYFFQKLVPDEREKSVILATRIIKKRLLSLLFNHTEVPQEYYIEVLLFLLSNMDEKQQLNLIRDRNYEVLKSFLEWPFQSFFLETSYYVRNFLDNINFECMLEIIIDKIMRGYTDWNYSKIFREFWKQSLDTHKKFYVRKCTSNSSLLLDLFIIGEKESIGLILKYATVNEREEIIFNYNGKNICEFLVYSQDFVTLSIFLQQCILSKDVLDKFKVEFREHIKSHNPDKKLEKERGLWNDFAHFLAWFDFELIKKEDMTKGNNNLAKKA